MVWSRYLQKIPLLGHLYRHNYFALKRFYLNTLRETGIRPGPSVVHWLCTNRCNQKCVYCEANANEVRSNELKTHEIKAVLDELKELRVSRFFVTGGEPMMRKDLWEVLEHAKKCGLTVGMISNSTLYARFKEQLRQADFQSIWTSVDGLPATHDQNRGEQGAFETTMNALRYYREIDIPLRVVNTLVHPGNRDQLPELFERLKEAGMNRWRFALSTNVGRASGEDKWVLPDRQIEELFDYVEEARARFDIELSEELGYLGCRDLPTRNTPFICPSGLSFCVIMPDGHVLPCQVVYDNRFSEGNVREKSFTEIWATGFQRFRKVEIEGVCGSCRHRSACSGGCWARVVNDGASCLRRIWDPKHYGHETLSGQVSPSQSTLLQPAEGAGRVGGAAQVDEPDGLS